MRDTNAYFRAAGWSLEVAERFIAERSEAFQRRKGYVKECGGPSAKVVTCGDETMGFTSDAEGPIHGWRQKDVIGLGKVWVPNTRTAAGREARDTLARLKVPGSSAFTERLGLRVLTRPAGGGGGGYRYVAVGYHRLRDPGTGDWVIVIEVPLSGEDEDSGEQVGLQIPRDAVRMARSAFYALLEAQPKEGSEG